MLVFALDANGHLQSTSSCTKGIDYRCPECQSPVRLRAGQVHREHFYHYQSNSCRWSNVGVEHRLCQQLICEQWPAPCHQEYWFRAIGRIADIFVPSQGIVFEIQFSPIKPQEVIQRVLDYQKLGIRVLWLLHGELFLHGEWDEGGLLTHLPHYYFSAEKLNSLGNSSQLQLIDDLGGEQRLFTLQGLWHAEELSWPKFSINQDSWLHLIWQRRRRWALGIQGDWLSSIL